MLILGLTVPHLDVNKNPSKAIKKNCENVIRFPLPGSSLKSNNQHLNEHIQVNRNLQVLLQFGT